MQKNMDLKCDHAEEKQVSPLLLVQDRGNMSWNTYIFYLSAATEETVDLEGDESDDIAWKNRPSNSSQ